MAERDDAVFADARPMLLGLAYRILGSRSEAEDALQDTWLKWRSADKAEIENPRSWLTTICTRRCIDMLRSAHRTRVDYVGVWLPEPIHAPAEYGPEERMELASSLGTAFLLVLERLAPKERAAYLLHEIFDVPYPEVARMLGIQEAACRKLVSRARANIARAQVGHAPPPDRQEELLAAFETAIAEGRTARLAALLSQEVELCADGGGRVAALREILRGKEEVLSYVAASLRQYWSGYRWVRADINGARGVVLEKDGEVTASVTFAYDAAGAATGIYIMRNPDKLAGLAASIQA